MNLGLFPLEFQSIETSFLQRDFKQLGKHFGFWLMDLIMTAISGKALHPIVGMPKVGERGTAAAWTVPKALTAGFESLRKQYPSSNNPLKTWACFHSGWECAGPRATVVSAHEHQRASSIIYCADAGHSWVKCKLSLRKYTCSGRSHI